MIAADLLGPDHHTEGYIFLREFLPNVSPALLDMLTFGQGPVLGSLILALVTSVLGLVGAGINRLPLRVRSPLLMALAAVFMVGLLAEIIILAWGNQGIGLEIRRVVFQAGGLSLIGAVLVFAIAVGITSAGTPKAGAFNSARTPSHPSSKRTLQLGQVRPGHRLYAASCPSSCEPT